MSRPLQGRIVSELAELIGPNTDALADVPTVQFLHDRLGQEHPISGDMIARHKTTGNEPGNKKTADELELAAVTSNPVNE